MHTEIVVIGAGGHASVVVDALELSMPATNLRIVDADQSKVSALLLDHVIQDMPQWDTISPCRVHVAIGDNAIREKVVQGVIQCGHDLFSVIHPNSTGSRYSDIGPGSFIAASSVLGAGAKLADGVIINHGAVVDHDCRIGGFSHIAPNATLGGEVKVGERVLIGAGATVLPGITIGDDIVIGAGSVVTHDLKEQGCTYVGMPTKRISHDRD